MLLFAEDLLILLHSIPEFGLAGNVFLFAQPVVEYWKAECIPQPNDDMNLAATGSL